MILQIPLKILFAWNLCLVSERHPLCLKETLWSILVYFNFLIFFFSTTILSILFLQRNSPSLHGGRRKSRHGSKRDKNKQKQSRNAKKDDLATKSTTAAVAGEQLEDASEDTGVANTRWVILIICRHLACALNVLFSSFFCFFCR